MDSAVARVLNTPELIESILLHVDQSSLLRSTQISRHFNSIVKNTSSLRKRLFLDARPKVSAHLLKGDNNVLVPQVGLNPLLFDTTQVDFTHKPTLELPSILMIILDPNARAYLNVGGVYGQSAWEINRALTMEQFPALAICQNMLLLDVSITQLDIEIVSQSRPWATTEPGFKNIFGETSDSFHTTLQTPQGMRFGQVLKLVKSIGIRGEVDISVELSVKLESVLKGSEASVGELKQHRRLVLEDRVIEVSASDPRLVSVDVSVYVEHVDGTRCGMAEEGYMGPVSFQ